MSKHTPGPWVFEQGGGHAPNRICGSESIQVNGWAKSINGYSNASYSDRVCENLGDTSLPGPAANARLIAAAPELLEALQRTLNWLASYPGGCAEGAYEQARDAIDKATGAQS